MYYSIGETCFEEHMKSGGMPSQCNCPKSCERTSYTYRLKVSKLLDVDHKCRSPTRYFGPLGMQEKLTNTFLDYFKSNYLPHATELNRCLNTLERVAHVNIHISSKYITRMKTELRVTPVDQLASLGERSTSPSCIASP